MNPNYQGLYQGMQNACYSPTPAEAIASRIRSIDEELSRFSEERKAELLTERAKLLRAQEALR